MSAASENKTNLSRYDDSRVAPNNPFTRFPRENIYQPISTRFERVVARDPSHIAIRVNGQTTSYGSLNKMANRIAHAILSSNDKHNHTVAVLVENDAATIAAILGVLKAGKIYVPLDASYSPTWSKYILEDTGARIVLSGDSGLRLASSWISPSHSLINFDSLRPDWSEENPEIDVPPHSLSHILYTSGSTGHPKGVMDTHRNTLHYVMRLTNASHISMTDRITLVRPPSSSGALMNLYLTLLNGATLFPINLRQTSLSALGKRLKQEEITILHVGATVFRHFAQQLKGTDKFQDLRLIRLSSGQAFDIDVKLFKQHFPDALLLHVLSSTEANTYRVHFLDKNAPIPNGALPVGYEVEDIEVLILDDTGMTLAAGETGEIAIRSEYLFPGYWHNPDLTIATFISNRDNSAVRIFRTGDLGRLSSGGCLEYLGRKDFRLKIRGHSIQAEEVELALQRIRGIAQAAVTAHKDPYGDDRMIAYVAPSERKIPTIGQIREALKEKLPDYMLPSKVVILNKLPLNPNGKVDRHELPVPPPDRPNLGTALIEPSTAMEKVLAKIWSEALSINTIGIHDVFFDLGGDSIVAGRVIARMEKIFPWNITLPEFYEACTVAKAAALLTRKAPDCEVLERAAKLFLSVDSLSPEEVKVRVAQERDKRTASEQRKSP